MKKNRRMKMSFDCLKKNWVWVDEDKEKWKEKDEYCYLV
jgi:hypothetical protein